MRTIAIALAVLLGCVPSRADAQVTLPPVPPEKAAQPIASVALVNPGFESTLPGNLGAPQGWWTVQHAGPRSYTFTLDTKKPRSGERSLKVENIGPEPFGTIYQFVDATPYRGKRVRLAAWVRTEGAAGNRYGSGAGLHLHAMKGGYPIEHAMMREDTIHGTTAWARYEVALNIPGETDRIEAGLSLFGPGIAWLDDVALDVLDASAAAGPPRAGVLVHRLSVSASLRATFVGASFRRFRCSIGLRWAGRRARDRRYRVDEALARLFASAAFGIAVRVLRAVLRVDDCRGQAHRRERLVCDLVRRRNGDDRTDRRVVVPRVADPDPGREHRAHHSRRHRIARRRRFARLTARTARE